MSKNNISAIQQLVSRVIEDLLPLARDEVRRRFMEAMVADLRIAATDPFASHVIEKLLFLAAFRRGDSASDFAEYRWKYTENISS